ncbi:MAG: Asp-tRNA(Asn)/Glu-tRNA(Gln) amidotransferase subunit GatC [Elusimicrobiota bacterium]
MDQKDVEKLAKLSRLKFSKKEKDKIPGQLLDIIDYVDQLSELDTTDTPPMGQPFIKNLKLAPDKVENSETGEDIRKNGPDFEDGFFKVKKVIE